MLGYFSLSQASLWKFAQNSSVVWDTAGTVCHLSLCRSFTVAVLRLHCLPTASSMQGFSPGGKTEPEMQPQSWKCLSPLQYSMTCFQSKHSLQIPLKRKTKECLLIVVVCSDLELECGTENCLIWPVLRKRQRWHSSNTAKQSICAKYFLVHTHSGLPAKKLIDFFYLFSSSRNCTTYSTFLIHRMFTFWLPEVVPKFAS